MSEDPPKLATHDPSPPTHVNLFLGSFGPDGVRISFGENIPTVGVVHRGAIVMSLSDAEALGRLLLDSIRLVLRESGNLAADEDNEGAGRSLN